MNDRSADPLVQTARREAVVVASIGVVALVYTVVYCSLYAYDRPLETMTFVWGFPDWVFWGVLVPWVVCIVLSCWLSHIFIDDHDLEIELGMVSQEEPLAAAAHEAMAPLLPHEFPPSDNPYHVTHPGEKPREEPPRD